MNVKDWVNASGASQSGNASSPPLPALPPDNLPSNS